ncbi:ABC-F family ATP-binding cassette domain-containing protein, partial [Aduncisulcus paluster]
MKNIRIGYLSQSPEFDIDATVMEQVFKGDSDILTLVRDYEAVTADLEKAPHDQALIQSQLNLMQEMNAKNAWELESQVKMVLTTLGVHDFKAKIGTLSGGQKKRVALAQALITPCDL